MRSPFELSSQLVDDIVALDPLLATQLGVPGSDHLWPDMSPEGWDSRASLLRRYRRDFQAQLDHEVGEERLAARVLLEWIDIQLRGYESGDHQWNVGHMATPLDEIRGVFDIMAVHSEEGWESVCQRLETVGDAWNGYLETLLKGLEHGLLASRRQVESAVRQLDELAGDDGAWDLLVAKASPKIAPGAEAALTTAKAATADFAASLRTEYLPRAPREDGVGLERYVRAAERFLGMDVDPEEIYDWAWSEIRRLSEEIVRVGEEISPDEPDPLSVGRLLEGDPGRAAYTIEEFVDFIEGRLEQALRDLEGSHFEVSPEIRKLTVNIAPPGHPLGAYYLAPSEDFSRPGGVWYSIGDREFHPLYQEVSTAYHEGFPGHHLQIGTSMSAGDRLSRAHRLLVWYSGYGEGWALYAERLMDELGYFEMPEYRFGMLASHLFRAARVVVDIGLHLGLRIPDEAPLFGGERWDFDRAVAYMERIGLQPHDYAVSEVTRYLGWPGQAISYKVGEREILAVRDEVRGRGRFDLKAFHHSVLQDGEMGLALLRENLLS